MRNENVKSNRDLGRHLRIHYTLNILFIEDLLSVSKTFYGIQKPSHRNSLKLNGDEDSFETRNYLKRDLKILFNLIHL